MFKFMHVQHLKAVRWTELLTWFTIHIVASPSHGLEQAQEPSSIGIQGYSVTGGIVLTSTTASQGAHDIRSSYAQT